MKRIIKNLSLILVLVFVTISFAACGSLNSQIVFNADGSIDEIVNIELKTEDVLESGHSVNEVRLWIYEQAQNQVDEMIALYNANLENAISSSSEARKNELKNYENGLTKIISNWQNSKLKVGIKFASADVYKYYYNIEENESSADIISKGFFYDEYYFKSGTEFTKHRGLFNSLANKFNEKYPNLISEDNKLSYTYVTSSKRVHSNADDVTYSAGYYYHTWEIDSNNIDEPVLIYYKVANPANWIFFGLGLTIVLLLILGTIGFFIQINKNKRNKKLITKEKLKINKNSLLIKLRNKLKNKKNNN